MFFSFSIVDGKERRNKPKKEDGGEEAARDAGVCTHGRRAR